MKPKKFSYRGIKLIDDAFLEGKREISDEKLEEFTEVLEVDADIESFKQACKEAQENFEPGDTSIDEFLAKEIHRALNLSRRQAADPEFWNYLSIVVSPQMVRHRWTSCARKRFVAERNMMRHAFSRLWWIAELTEENGDYNYTEKAFKKQDIAQNIFDNNFSHFEKLLPPVLKRLAEEPSEVAKKYGEILNREFAVRLLEDLDEEDIEKLAESVRVKSRLEAGYEVEEEVRSLLGLIKGT
jgi:thymidylate synthase ThyX